MHTKEKAKGTSDLMKNTADTDLYKHQYEESFVEKWDELIDWDARTKGEERFFPETLRRLGAKKVLDVATGTGYHSITLLKEGFDVHSVDGSLNMLHKASENAVAHGALLRTIHADWRELGMRINEKYDAVVCLGNSFTHLFDEADRRKVMAEFYAVLRYDGVLIVDQRNYDGMLEYGFSSKHRYYYANDRVKAYPVHLDDELTVFQYEFPDGSVHKLNMYPLRSNYFLRLAQEAGFSRVETYSDFRAEYDTENADFFVHVMHKV